MIPTISGRCCGFLRYALENRRAEALASIGDDLKAAARRVEWWSFYLAECYGFICETDEAIDWLENGVRLGFINYPFLSERDIVLGKFRGNPGSTH